MAAHEEGFAWEGTLMAAHAHPRVVDRIPPASGVAARGVLMDHGGALLGDHDGIGGSYSRHDGGVYYPQPVETSYPQSGIDHGHWVLAHPASSSADYVRQQGTTIYHIVGTPQGFPTPTRLVEVYSERLLEHHSQHRNIASLRAPDPSLEMAPEDAAARSIGEGDWVRIRTAQGKAVARAKLVPGLAANRVRPSRLVGRWPGGQPLRCW
jgi:anaerobic selenocysteine-containing dehydrogenase